MRFSFHSFQVCKYSYFLSIIGHSTQSVIRNAEEKTNTIRKENECYKYLNFHFCCCIFQFTVFMIAWCLEVFVTF